MTTTPPPKQRSLAPADLSALEQQSRAQDAARRRRPVPEAPPDPTLQRAPERAEPVVPKVPVAFKAGAPITEETEKHELLVQLSRDFGLQTAPTETVEIAGYRWTLRAPNYPDHDWYTETLVSGRASAARYQLVRLAASLAAVNGVPLYKLFGLSNEFVADPLYPPVNIRYQGANRFIDWVEEPGNLMFVELIERAHNALDAYHEKVKGDHPLWAALKPASTTPSAAPSDGASGPPPSLGAASSPPIPGPETSGTTSVPPASSSEPASASSKID
jgi:hypothetical protein